MLLTDHIKIFSGTSNEELALDIVKNLGLKLAAATFSKFSDGEVRVEINENVRGFEVIVIQSMSSPVNDSLMELLIIVDALKRASASSITAIIPYYGYARQDKKNDTGRPISAKLVANLIQKSGVDSLITMDLHVDQIEGFFDIPVENVQPIVPVFVPYYSKKFEGRDLCVVAPDVGSVRRSKFLAQKLGAKFAIIDKQRERPNVSEVVSIIGNVSGTTCLLSDDIVDTAGTIVNASRSLLSNGAFEVYACCTHPVLSGPAIENIGKSPIIEFATTDSIRLSTDKIERAGIKVLRSGEMFAEIIRRIVNRDSLLEFFS